jgi:hypothetical protein
VVLNEAQETQGTLIAVCGLDNSNELIALAHMHATALASSLP